MNAVQRLLHEMQSMLLDARLFMRVGFATTAAHYFTVGPHCVQLFSSV